MGNIGSQTANISQFPDEPWSYSFPRAQPSLIYQQHKVLPERDSRQKLRSTFNGEILQCGGTLTGRQNQEITTRIRASTKEVKRCDSEPDLRFSPPIPEDVKSPTRTKKKYKAPAPPSANASMCKNMQNESSSNRKPRLFKTRLETIKCTSSPSPNPNLQDAQNSSVHEKENAGPNISNYLQDDLNNLSKSNNTNDFSQIQSNSIEDNINVDENVCKDKLKTLDPNINFKKFIESDREENKKINNQERQLQADQPKPFYFGMEDRMKYNINENLNLNYNLDTSNLIDMSSFDSDLSSGLDVNGDSYKSDIDIRLRPMLPKKQIEIPRFSPATAWKLLSSIDSGGPKKPINEVIDFQLIEERIEKYSRPPPPAIQVARLSNDKSGDSGISGDAGPTGYEDSGEMILTHKIEALNRNELNKNRISWTPQQDLEDDSSMEEYGNEIEHHDYQDNDGVRTKPHMFSLSLPRDNHLAAYLLKKSSDDELKNSKRMSLLQKEENNNWLLSKSTSNSLTNGFNSLDMRLLDAKNENKQSSLRVMYLPQFDYKTSNRSHSMDRIRTTNKLTLHSKSCDNLTTEVASTFQREDLQDPCVQEIRTPQRLAKKFTFQSTIRQIERRLIADKLSKEAEKKEKQRLREIEAMRKVEEEFQKKRDRERANIRQQLRMYSMDDEVPWSSLPPNLESVDKLPSKSSDTETTSSPATSSPLQSTKKLKIERNERHFQKNTKNSISKRHKIKTQVLSEYKQSQREYRDYRNVNKKPMYGENSAKNTTVYPPIKCNMPKIKGKGANGRINPNRKEISCTERGNNDNEYSDDLQVNKSANFYNKKCGPITRF